MFSQKVLLLAHDAHFGIHEMLHYIPKTRPYGLKQFEIFNVQHFMNLFPKVAKIVRKRLFTNSSGLNKNLSKLSLNIKNNQRLDN